MSDITKEELKALYEDLQLECLNLEEENQELLKVAQMAVKGMQENRELAEYNQRIIDELLKFIQSQLNKEFTLDDIPRFKC